jgi:hypothetical protein
MWVNLRLDNLHIDAEYSWIGGRGAAGGLLRLSFSSSDGFDERLGELDEALVRFNERLDRSGEALAGSARGMKSQTRGSKGSTRP